MTALVRHTSCHVLANHTGLRILRPAVVISSELHSFRAPFFLSLVFLSIHDISPGSSIVEFIRLVRSSQYIYILLKKHSYITRKYYVYNIKEESRGRIYDSSSCQITLYITKPGLYISTTKLLCRSNRQTFIHLLQDGCVRL